MKGRGQTASTNPSEVALARHLSHSHCSFQYWVAACILSQTRHLGQGRRVPLRTKFIFWVGVEERLITAFDGCDKVRSEQASLQQCSCAALPAGSILRVPLFCHR